MKYVGPMPRAMSVFLPSDMVGGSVSEGGEDCVVGVSVVSVIFLACCCRETIVVDAVSTCVSSFGLGVASFEGLLSAVSGYIKKFAHGIDVA
jgi:hypothetical protein